MAMDDSLPAKLLLDASKRLALKRIPVGHATLSVRVPGQSRFGMLEFCGEETSQPRTVAIPDSASTGSDGEGVHGTVYQARPDVGAVLCAKTAWGSRLREVGHAMPGVFDEQVRHLGRSVEVLVGWPRHESRSMRHGHNAFLLDGAVLALGFNIDRLVFNAELFEKCAKAYLLAYATGARVGRIPWLICWIAHRRLLRDERRAAEAFARGEVPAGLTAY